MTAPPPRTRRSLAVQPFVLNHDAHAERTRQQYLHKAERGDAHVQDVSRPQRRRAATICGTCQSGIKHCPAVRSAVVDGVISSASAPKTRHRCRCTGARRRQHAHLVPHGDEIREQRRLVAGIALAAREVDEIAHQHALGVGARLARHRKAS
jgi:hypothetical protein